MKTMHSQIHSNIIMRWFLSFFVTVLCAAELPASAKEANISAILKKAKKAKKEDGNINFCGFYVGMSKSDADALVAHYALKDGEWSFFGDPLFRIDFSLQGIRRITASPGTPSRQLSLKNSETANSYHELCQAVADCIGTLARRERSISFSNEEVWYEHTSFDKSVRLTMAESVCSSAKIPAGFSMTDISGLVRRKSDLNTVIEKVLAQTTQRMSDPSFESAVESVLNSMVDIPGKGYKVGKTEVTQGQWQGIVGNNPSKFKDSDNPVDRVSWDDCQVFLAVLNSLPAVEASGLEFRLLTEDEWEHACRAGATGEYCKLADGTEIQKSTLGRVAWFEDNAVKCPHPVAQKEPNAFGLYDMLGNVWEWTQSTVDKDRFGFDRGGSWQNSAKCCRNSDRTKNLTSDRVSFRGFRLCASPKSKKTTEDTAERNNEEDEDDFWGDSTPQKGGLRGTRGAIKTPDDDFWGIE